MRVLKCVLAHVGGNWNNGSNDGLSYWNLNNSTTNANANIGGRLLIRFLIIAFHYPWHSPKIRHKEHGLVGLSKDREANKKVGIS